MNWKNAYLESQILAASPLELVNILYDHAAVEIQRARQSLARGDVAGRSRSISKVIAIIGELEISLDLDAGGEIAANLGRLYQYMRARLTAGNLQQADAPLAEVERLLASIADAWRAITPAQAANSASGPWLDSSVTHLPVAEEPSYALGGWSV